MLLGLGGGGGFGSILISSENVISYVLFVSFCVPTLLRLVWRFLFLFLIPVSLFVHVILIVCVPLWI